MPLPGELILQGYTQNDKDTLLEIHGRPTSLTASISSIIGSPTASHARHSGQGGRMSSVYALSVRGSNLLQHDTRGYELPLGHHFDVQMCYSCTSAPVLARQRGIMGSVNL